MSARKLGRYSREVPPPPQDNYDNDVGDADDDLFDDEEDEDEGEEENGSSSSVEYYAGVARYKRTSGGSVNGSAFSSAAAPFANGRSTGLTLLSGGGALGGDSTKRDHHNRLERKRRASIKDCFHELRAVLPDIMGGKPSRATILQRAAQELAYFDKDNAQKMRDIRIYKMEIDDLNAKSVELQRTLESVYNRLPYGSGGGSEVGRAGDAESDERDMIPPAEDGSYSSGPSEAYM